MQEITQVCISEQSVPIPRHSQCTKNVDLVTLELSSLEIL